MRTNPLCFEWAGSRRSKKEPYVPKYVREERKRKARPPGPDPTAPWVLEPTLEVGYDGFARVELEPWREDNEPTPADEQKARRAERRRAKRVRQRDHKQARALGNAPQSQPINALSYDSA